MKITSLTVTDEDGTQHTWDGLTGYVTHLDLREAGASKQSPGRVYGRQIIATLTTPVDHRPRSVARSAGSGQFTTAEDAAEHPDTTVTEQLG